MRDISNDGVDELFEWEDALDVFGLDSPEMPVLILQFTEMCKRNNTTPVKLLSNLSEEFFAAKP